MSKIIRTIQEIVHVPEGAFSDWVNEMANFIDAEVSNERAWIDNDVIKVDSVAIVYGDDQFRFPFAHSGDEFRGFVKRLEQFNRLK